jgi:hypothetical protein
VELCDCTASGSSFVFAAVVAVTIAAIAAVIAAVIAVLLFRRSRWLLCASLAVWLYLDFMSLLKSSCKRLNPRPSPRTWPCAASAALLVHLDNLISSHPRSRHSVKENTRGEIRMRSVPILRFDILDFEGHNKLSDFLS